MKLKKSICESFHLFTFIYKAMAYRAQIQASELIIIYIIPRSAWPTWKSTSIQGPSQKKNGKSLTNTMKIHQAQRHSTSFGLCNFFWKLISAIIIKSTINKQQLTTHIWHILTSAQNLEAANITQPTTSGV